MRALQFVLTTEAFDFYGEEKKIQGRRSWLFLRKSCISTSLLRSRPLGCHVTLPPKGALCDIPKNGCGGDYGRFPFNKNHRFKFSEFSLVEWNASHSFPEFEVTCPATSRNAGWNFVVFENGGLFEYFRGLKEQGDCETISCTILDSNDDVILLAAVACFMRRESNRVNGISK